MPASEPGPASSRNGIRARIRAFILTDLLDGADPSQLSDETSLERAHVVDSARLMELILFVEKAFGFEVQDEEALPENFDSVDNLVAYVERKLLSA